MAVSKLHSSAVYYPQNVFFYLKLLYCVPVKGEIPFDDRYAAKL